MRVRTRLIAAVLPSVLTLAAARGAAAQQPAPARPSYERQIPAALLAQVKIGEDSARVLALAKVPGAVEAVELLRDHGNLLWVWDVKVKGKRGITEVSVNAIDGKVESHVE
jgi:uncharacterized membrane protein YkoI